MTLLTTTRIAALCLTCLGGTVAAASETAANTGFDLLPPTAMAMLDHSAPIETGVAALIKSEDMAKRGRGRGGDDDDDDDGRSGRDKPRVPGGSGCDDPGDVAEHPECRGGAPSNGGGGGANPRNGDDSGSGRDKPRIPGGSGCDDPGDIAEHPECRG